VCNPGTVKCGMNFEQLQVLSYSSRMVLRFSATAKTRNAKNPD